MSQLFVNELIYKMIEFGKYVLAADILNCMQFPVLGCLQKITYE